MFNRIFDKLNLFMCLILCSEENDLGTMFHRRNFHFLKVEQKISANVIMARVNRIL